MTSELTDMDKAKSKAMVNLMSRPDSAFFTTICFSMKYIWDESIPTACTNGTFVKLNPQFFMNLTQDERVFLLLHESCHVAYLHMARLNERDPQKFNIAADHVINLMLIERGFKMPSVGLADKQYTGMSTEEVYNLLPTPPENSFDMDLEPGEGDPEELEKAVEDILVRASLQSKMDNDKPGTIPGEVQIFLDNLLKPKLPWNRILQKYMYALAKNDYSFRKPNRRFFPTHHLPSLYSEKLMNIAVAVDASGSVSDEEFKRFVSEIDSILRMMKPEKISLIQFDTQIHSVTPIRNSHELMKCQFAGRGGTDITPVVEWANANKPQLLLIFSDGEFNFPDEKIKNPTVWLIHDSPKFTAPYGKVIHYQALERK